MKSYPSISTKFNFDNYLYVFDKLDGSNIRAEWSKKKGFYKFGSRNRLIDAADSHLGEAVTLVNEKAEQLNNIFLSEGWDRVVAFFEYGGENSFAGSHEDEPHSVTLIDVAVYKKGYVSPEDFICIFPDDMRATLIYRGPLTSELIDEIKDGSMDGMTFEGVVCKWYSKKKKNVDMFKIKSRLWLNKLKTFCHGNDALYRRLM